MKGMNNIFITGERWSSCAGQLITEIKDMLLCEVGGYWVNITRDKKDDNVRVFDLTSLYDNDNNNTFFKKDDSSGISKLDIEVFNTKGVEMLQRAFLHREIFVLNEIGFLESKAYSFTKEIVRLLDSSKIVIALVKGISCPYIDTMMLREDIELFKITEENKSNMKDNIIKLLKSWKVPLAI
jgi:nucleoside-triphosphatase THEP1